MASLCLLGVVKYVSCLVYLHTGNRLLLITGSCVGHAGNDLDLGAPASVERNQLGLDLLCSASTDSTGVLYRTALYLAIGDVCLATKKGAEEGRRAGDQRCRSSNEGASMRASRSYTPTTLASKRYVRYELTRFFSPGVCTASGCLL